MKSIVIKLGGSILDQLDSTFFRDCRQLLEKNIHPLIVHGGGPMISRHFKRLGIETSFIAGRRYTDQASLQYVLQSLAGDVNKKFVARCIAEDLPALGLSGIDLKLLQAKVKDRKYGYVGEVVKVRAKPILSLLSLGWIPCVAPVGIDGQGQIYNINADEAAASIAQTLGSEKLVLVSDVDGVLINNKLLQSADRRQLERYIKNGDITGGMIPKVQAAITALQGSLREVVIVNGKQKHFLTQTQAGTQLLREADSVHATLT